MEKQWIQWSVLTLLSWIMHAKRKGNEKERNHQFAPWTKQIKIANYGCILKRVDVRSQPVVKLCQIFGEALLLSRPHFDGKRLRWWWIMAACSSLLWAPWMIWSHISLTYFKVIIGRFLEFRYYIWWYKFYCCRIYRHYSCQKKKKNQH